MTMVTDEELARRRLRFATKNRRLGLVVMVIGLVPVGLAAWRLVPFAWLAIGAFIQGAWTIQQLLLALSVWVDVIWIVGFIFHFGRDIYDRSSLPPSADDSP